MTDKYSQECLKACYYANDAGYSIYSSMGSRMIVHYLSKYHQFTGTFHQLYTDAVQAAEERMK